MDSLSHIICICLKHSERHRYVNVILVRAPFETKEQEVLYERYKDDILFLGIMSFEAYPLRSPNPYTTQFEPEDYLSRFPGYVAKSLSVDSFHCLFSHLYLLCVSLIVNEYMVITDNF